MLAALAGGVLAAHWFADLFLKPEGVAHAVLIIGLVAAFGLLIGTVRVWGVSLGVAGVLFAGLIFGHFGVRVDEGILDFAREFGLILFVYAIGIQVGPGFIASLRRQGLPLNLMAAAIVVLGVITTVVIYKSFMSRDQFAAAVGLLSGATTNTPSLAAAQQALKDVPNIGADAAKLPGLAYAVAYPFGIIGIILIMLMVRWILRIDPHKEAQALAALGAGKHGVRIRNFEVTNPNLDGLQLGQVPTLGDSGVVISRILHKGNAQLARPESVLYLGDVVLAVGPDSALDQLRVIIGKESHVDVMAIPSKIATRRILVTKSAPLGKTIAELDLRGRFGVNVTRIHRAEIELPVTPNTRLQFADNLAVVGEPDAIRAMADELGDSPRQLNHPQIIPVFVGIALGVIIGSWPIEFFGMKVPVRLGLAGGPLLVAIILSRLGKIGTLVWYMPISANFLMREIGIGLFLAGVGLRAGDRFVATLVEGQGLYWMAYGAIITIVPLTIVAFFARLIYGLNYLSLCGLLAGSMTDPPALAFAGSITGSDAPSISYATVYPLVMILRVVCAQALVLIFL